MELNRILAACLTPCFSYAHDRPARLCEQPSRARDINPTCLEAAAAKAGRNARCACGSGLKSKQCHGRTHHPFTKPEPTLYPVFEAQPRASVMGLQIEIESGTESN